MDWSPPRLLMLWTEVRSLNEQEVQEPWSLRCVAFFEFWLEFLLELAGNLEERHLLWEM